MNGDIMKKAYPKVDALFTEIINYAHNIDFTKLHVEFIKIDTFVSFLIEYFLFLASGTFNLYYLVSPISLYVLKCYVWYPLRSRRQTGL